MKIGIVALLLLVIIKASAQDYLTDYRYTNNTGPGLTMGYLNQQFHYRTGEYHFYNDGVWGDRNRLHGFYLGLAHQSNWVAGFGLYTGFNLDFCFSFNDPTGYYYAQSVNDAYDSYVECGLEIPLHLAFKLPLGYDFALGLHSGIGCTLTYVSVFSDSRGYFNDWSGLGEFLKVVNLTYDFAVYMELAGLRLDAQWSTGFIRQASLTDWDQVLRDKFLLGLTLFIN